MTNYWGKRVLRNKLKLSLLVVSVATVLFLYHQVYFAKRLSDEAIHSLSKTVKLSNREKPIVIRGSSTADSEKYKPNFRGNFVCFTTRDEIDFSKVNDDYCDCVHDGSDEPGTNACQNGKFYCSVTPENLDFIPSSRVNDGYCDCCDGTDEWAQLFPPVRLDEMVQKKLGRHQSPCPNLCPNEY